MQANWLLVCALLPGLAAAEVCDPTRLAGSYAFQLSGTTTISGTAKPTASLGALALDGNGKISGTASAMFSGFLLGNPVTGAYEAKWDCTVAWKLQDDSGAFQHFNGTYAPDGMRVQFKQTDPGGAQQGTMEKTSGMCSAANLEPAYSYAVSGSTTPMQPGDVPRTVSMKGVLDIAANGTFQVQSDCSVLFQLTLPNQTAEGTAPFSMNLRGFLVNGGKEILAFQTDPGAMVAARFRSVIK